MSKYINADKIPYTRIRYEDDFDVEFSPALAFKEDIDKMPSADVVEVVRCKDCKYYINPTTNPQDNSDWYLCKFFDRLMDYMDYCSCGERREI